jgi:hypothetical protein
MPKTQKELNQGAQEALDELKKKEAKPDDLKWVGVQKTGAAMKAAEEIQKRKKETEKMLEG